MLELIAKVLQFSDDQKEAVGLRTGTILTSLLKNLVGVPPPPDVEVSP